MFTIETFRIQIPFYQILDYLKKKIIITEPKFYIKVLIPYSMEKKITKKNNILKNFENFGKNTLATSLGAKR